MSTPSLRCQTTQCRSDTVEFRSRSVPWGHGDRLVLGHYMPHLLRERSTWLKNTVEARS
jgi:hypothetical protein